MWICPKCSRENGNSFNSCKGCGYVISEDEKIIAINNTKKQLADYSSKHTAYKTHMVTLLIQDLSWSMMKMIVILKTTTVTICLMMTNIMKIKSGKYLSLF